MRDRIIEVLKKHTKTGSIPAPEESLFDGGFLDSFSLADFVVDLEEEFHFHIPDSDLNPSKFESVERIEQYVSGRL